MKTEVTLDDFPIYLGSCAPRCSFSQSRKVKCAGSFATSNETPFLHVRCALDLSSFNTGMRSLLRTRAAERSVQMGGPVCLESSLPHSHLADFRKSKTPRTYPSRLPLNLVGVCSFPLSVPGRGTTELSFLSVSNNNTLTNRVYSLYLGCIIS